MTSNVNSGPSSLKQRWRRRFPHIAARAPTARSGEGERRGLEGVDERSGDRRVYDGLGHIDEASDGW